jgi:hypothetical protein
VNEWEMVIYYPPVQRGMKVMQILAFAWLNLKVAFQSTIASARVYIDTANLNTDHCELGLTVTVTITLFYLQHLSCLKGITTN